MIKALSRFIYFRIMRWTVAGQFPHELPKYIVTVAPHTSNWDFLVGVIGRKVTNLNARYLGKKELFKPPFGWIFYALGGYPVDRSRNTNLVEAVVGIFNQHEKFVIAVAPEGTRSKVEKLKSGFYYIARAAQIPIVLVGFDYAKRNISISDPFYPTEDVDQDMAFIWNHYKEITGKNPELGIS